MTTTPFTNNQQRETEVDAIRQDIRFAFRTLAKSRLFSIVAVAMLALGIGVNTAVFSLVDAVAFKPLPFADAEQLVDLHEFSATQLCSGCSVGTSYPGFLDWRNRTTSFASMGAYAEMPASISGSEAPERVTASLASAELFATLGIRPALGRGILASEDQPGGTPVVVLGDDLWKRRFGGDSSIIGRAIRVNGVARTVVGVMPPRFRFPEFAELWLPFAQIAAESPRSERGYDVVARLRAGATIQQADAEVKSLAKALETEYPATQHEWSAAATSFRRDYAGEVTQLYAVMLGAVTCVLLIACANVAGLLLVRGSSRQKEIAIRLALGASRVQIVRQLLAESALLAVAGGAIGSVIAVWGVDFAVHSIGTAIPFWIDFGIDYRALAFCAITSLGTGVVFGVVPALRASSPNVQISLKEGGQSVSAGLARSRLRSALVIGELALAMVLLAGAGILMKSFLRLSSMDRQYDTHNVVTAQIEFLDRRYNEPSQIANAVSEMTTRFSRIPSVNAVSLSRFEFVAGFGRQDNRIRVEGLPTVPDGVSPRFYFAVTRSYFDLLQLPLREGRLFEPGDGNHGMPVVIINARMARRLWPNEPAVGHRLRLGSADSLPWLTIIGVVGDVRDSLTRQTGGDAFVPFAQSPGRPVSMLVRAARGVDNPLQLLPQLQAEAKLVDPDLPLVKPMTVDQQRHDSYWPYEMFALFMGGFAMLAVLMGAIGLYGVVAYGVTQRTREIGIRMALGADQGQVLRLVTSGGARLALIGVLLGFLGAAGASQVLRAMIFGANPIDVTVYLLGGLLLTFVALLASYVPARRAASVSPLIALRAE